MPLRPGLVSGSVAPVRLPVWHRWHRLALLTEEVPEGEDRQRGDKAPGKGKNNADKGRGATL
eukprot:7735161-Heterocapsa_arctica.AAC.1